MNGIMRTSLWLAIVVSAIGAFCRDVSAAETLEITSTRPEHAVVGGRLHLGFVLEDDGIPVQDAYIYVDSDNGDLTAIKLRTDTSGAATVEVRSPAAGPGTVTAHTRLGARAHFSFDLPESIESRLMAYPSQNVLTPGQTADLGIRLLGRPEGEQLPAVVTIRIRGISSIPEVQLIDLDANGSGSVPITAGSERFLLNLAVSIPESIDNVDMSDVIDDVALVEVITPDRIELTFLEPTGAMAIETGSEHTFEVRLHTGDLGLQGWPIDISLEPGPPISNQPITDGAGIARFSVASTRPGSSRLEVRAGTVKASLDLEFVTPPPERNHYIFSYGIDGPSRPMQLEIRADEIGFVPDGALEDDELYGIIKRSGLTLKRIVGDDFYVLTTSRPVSRTVQWKLARELKWRNTEIVLATGLPARLKGTSRELIVEQSIIAKFGPPEMDVHQVRNLLTGLPKYTFTGVDKFPFWSNVFALRLAPESAGDPVEAANALPGLGNVIFAQPNFLWEIDSRSQSQCSETTDPVEPWNDADSWKQWHHDNSAQHGGLLDADADTFEAWKFSMGKKDDGQATIIAVVDSGFDNTHCDLQENLLVPENGGGDLDAECFREDLLYGPSTHGTRAAGVAAARGGNGIGGAGACPLCKLLLFRYLHKEESNPLTLTNFGAIGRATTCGVSVISNSWGGLGPDQVLINAIDEAVTNNVVVLMAMSNEELDNCDENPKLRDTAAQQSAIAVGGISDDDTRNAQGTNARGYGDCMDILAPTKGDGAQPGLHTTDVGQLYEDDFGGTSAATPLIAGIVALMRTVNPDLLPLDVQRALQDTADKVDPDNAAYNIESGFDDPPGDQKSQHAYGRVNAFEAVRLVAPVKIGGKNNKDLMLRDHQWDWGNTERDSDIKFTCCPREKIEELQSVDIKLDVEPFVTTDAEISLSDFVKLESEKPRQGKDSRLYVRVRNRGQTKVDNAMLKVYWTAQVDELPKLPENFWAWPEFDIHSESKWQPLGFEKMSSVKYSGASVAGCREGNLSDCPPDSLHNPADNAKVVTFDIPASKWKKKNGQLVFMAVVDSKEDQVLATREDQPDGFDPHSPDESVVMDNNVTLWTSPPIESRKCLCLGGALAVLLILLLI